MLKNQKQSQLIFLEGLPSTGKSTNSGILLSQLQTNEYEARWIHEMARPHPTLFFYEACLSAAEYQEFIERFPGKKNILDQIKIRRNKYIAFDLLEIEWNQLLEEEELQVLKRYDVWNFPLQKYIETALDKWEYFAQQIDGKGQIILLDSSIFQFQIYTFLLEEAPVEILKTFLNRIYDIIAEFKPLLIYLYRENVNETINYIEESRGIQFFTRIWERDRHLPYYQHRPKGSEGYKEFLRDYQGIAEVLQKEFPYSKLSIDISEGNWNHYTSRILNAVSIEQMELPSSFLHNGKYTNKKLGYEMTIKNMVLMDPSGAKKRIYPKANNQFYIENLPVVLHLADPETLIIAGEQLCDRWTTLGLKYKRVERT
ncbi:MAG: hypothetical protein ACO1OT_02600 [Heyndrickxia sp.]